FIREGDNADLVLVDLDAPWTVTKENLLYKCGWSPFEGQQFRSRVMNTWVNGNLVYANGEVDRSIRGQRLVFDR
nr:dihydroorotase [Flavobacteriales bacterium]